MSSYNINDLIHSYNGYAEEGDQAGLDRRKRSHVQEAIQVFNGDDAKSILEIGSGPGSATQLFSDEGLEIECADFAPKMIEMVKKKGIVGHVMDCRDIEKIGKTYDGVFSVKCLLHIPKYEIADVENPRLLVYTYVSLGAYVLNR